MLPPSGELQGGTQVILNESEAGDEWEAGAPGWLGLWSIRLLISG